MLHSVPRRLVAASRCSCSFVLAALSSAQLQTATVPAAADATLLDGSGSLANGGGEHLFVGFTHHAEARRALVRFDVAAALPAGALVLTAELQLTIDRTFFLAPLPVTLHRVLQPWSEGASNPTGNEGGGMPAVAGDVTWTRRVWPAVPWTNGGGDHEGVASAVCPTPDLLVPVTWPSTPRLTGDVQAWLDDPATNHGWLLRTDESLGGATRRFSSRTNPSAGARPQLRVACLAPGSWASFENGCAGPLPRTALAGSFLPGTTATVIADGGIDSTFAAVFASLGFVLPGVELFPGCAAMLDATFAVLVGVGALDAAGRFTTGIVIPPAPSFAGTTLSAQALFDTQMAPGLRLGTAAVALLP